MDLRSEGGRWGGRKEKRKREGGGRKRRKKGRDEKKGKGRRGRQRGEEKEGGILSTGFLGVKLTGNLAQGVQEAPGERNCKPRVA